MNFLSIIFFAFIALLGVSLISMNRRKATEERRKPTPDTNATREFSISEAVSRLATSLARFETGFKEDGFILDPKQWKGRAARNNSPGNLRLFPNQKTNWSNLSNGTDDADYAKFPSPEAGWNALILDVRAKITGNTRTGLGPNSTLAQFISVWAPSVENPTASYISFVVRDLKIKGVGANTRFSEWVNI